MMLPIKLMASTCIEVKQGTRPHPRGDLFEMIFPFLYLMMMVVMMMMVMTMIMVMMMMMMMLLPTEHISPSPFYASKCDHQPSVRILLQKVC